MKNPAAPILWFNQIRKDDIPLVGGKGANLGEMVHAGIPVPNGFVVTAQAYFAFLEKTSLKEKILTELSGLDINDSKKLQAAAEKIKTAILAAQMPQELQDEIKTFYHELSGQKDRYVAVRSSATAEDLPNASFAGQQETFLNIKGYKDLVKHVQKCWASLFGARAIFYREEQGFSHMKVGIAVPVQLMVQSEFSGIMFTVNPLTNNRGEISVEAVYGLGEAIVSGSVTPDQFIVRKDTGSIIYRNFSTQTWQITKAGKVPVSKKYQSVQKVSDKLILKVAELGQKIEDHYGRPQDIEWAIEDNKVYIVQSRPVTTLTEKKPTEISEVDATKAAKFLLKGLPASPGVASGKVQIIKSASEINKVKEGDVLVAVMTNPDFVPAMRRAAAILTDEGGPTSHAAIVSRELGIPAVVGSNDATKILKTGELITVDGSSGRIYAGDLVVTHEVKSTGKSMPVSEMKTATKIYMNLAEPDLAPFHAAKNIDGVGLLRAEFMIANIGTHPRKFIKDGKSTEFIKILADGLAKFAISFGDRPVIYRFTDFRTNEYKNLKGGAEFEHDEPNPMIGFRGASRYIDDAEVFELEIEAIKYVRNKLGYKNLHVMVPFVRTVDQMVAVKKLLSAGGLRRTSNFKIWMMCEIPANVILLDEFIDAGIDGISIGTNDLTMLTLGVDRDNQKVANVYSEMNAAIIKSLEKIVTTCARRGVTCSICGQAPSVYPELVEMLVEWGVTSVSISPDVLDKTREIIYNAERKLINKKFKEKAAKKEGSQNKYFIRK